MAHKLDITDDQASFVTANVDAWHQLGITLDHSFTAEEAMVEGKLGGWDLRKSPAFTMVDRKKVPMTGRNAIVRTNPVNQQLEVIGDVGDGYNIIQNEEHAELLNTLVDESGAHFETAGALEGGRVVFITMKLPGHINIGGVDPVDNYIAAINSHDGSLAFGFMVTPVRISCANTMNLAFQRRSHIYRVRHTSGAKQNLFVQARQALDFTFNYLDAFQEQAEQLINTTMTQGRFESIIEREFGASDSAAGAAVTRANRKIEEMSQLFADSMTQEGIRGTAWAGLNALTEWADHYSPTRGDDRDNARAQKALLDPAFKNRALQLMTGA